MKYFARDLRLVQKHSAAMKGVFSISDLKNLLGETDPVALYRRIRHLQAEGVLLRFVRGFYTSDSPDLAVLCMRLHEDSYISLASALAKHLMIGTVPAKSIFAVKTGKTRTYSGPAGKIVYAGIRPQLMFGYEYSDGVRYATREKALLDVLYFYQKGRRFYFNIHSDISVEQVNPSIIRDWLPRYHNPRFVAFVKGYLDDRFRGQ